MLRGRCRAVAANPSLKTIRITITPEHRAVKGLAWSLQRKRWLFRGASCENTSRTDPLFSGEQNMGGADGGGVHRPLIVTLGLLGPGSWHDMRVRYDDDAGARAVASSTHAVVLCRASPLRKSRCGTSRSSSSSSSSCHMHVPPMSHERLVPPYIRGGQPSIGRAACSSAAAIAPAITVA